MHAIIYSWRTMVIVVVGLLMLPLQCNRKDKGSPDISKEQEDAAVSIYNKLPLFDKPGKKTKKISELYLGESVMLTGKEKYEKSDDSIHYTYVKLADGTVGWVKTEGVIKKAVSGVIKTSTRIYERPEKMTILDSSFNFLDIVAATYKKGDWVHVTGENRRIKGWITAEALSTDKNEVASAILVKKNIIQNNALPLRKRVVAAILDSPYPDSYVIRTLRKLATLYAIDDQAAEDELLDFSQGISVKDSLD